MANKKMSTGKLIRILLSRPRNAREARRRKRLWIAVILRAIMLIILIALIVLLISSLRSCSQKKDKKAETQQQEETRKSSGEATLAFTGGVILDQKILDCYVSETGTYDLTSPFQYIKDYYSEADLMTCEVEGAIGDDENTGVSGYPDALYPDILPSTLESVGIDYQFLATNHIYDGTSEGLSNTFLTYSDEDVKYGGIRRSADEDRYKVENVNGIKVGLGDYTYGVAEYFNQQVVEDADASLINMFKEASPEEFYATVKEEVAAMKKAGAEYIVYTLHWGAEYDFDPSEDQKAIAQKLCEIGVDVIIGTHPHVQQPIDVLTSGSHKMLCVYSIGSAFSNLRSGEEIDSDHCEDGVIVSLDLQKSAKGNVSVKNLKLTPTWVYRQERAGTEEEEEETEESGLIDEDNDMDDSIYDYYILPLDDVKGLEKKTGLSDIQSGAQSSYDRTMTILADGYKKAQKELIAGE